MGARTLRRAALLVAGALACGADAPATDPADSYERAVRYFETSVRGVHPSWANLFGYLHRRFGLALRDADGDLLHRAPADADPEMAAIFQRLVEPGAAVEPSRIARLTSQVDRMTASALHCDRIPLPDNWTEVLRAATRAGGYALTHAALAGRWSLEQGCGDAPAIESLQREQAERLVALVDDRDALAERFDAATDLWIEAIVMLYYLEEGARVRAPWIDALHATQRADGGWPRHPRAGRSDPHPTALALWVLLELRQPDAAPIRWVP